MAWLLEISHQNIIKKIDDDDEIFFVLTECLVGKVILALNHTFLKKGMAFTLFTFICGFMDFIY